MKDPDEYRCWFDLLRLSDRTKWSPQVEEVFGPVADSPFKTWLKELRPLLEPIERPTIEEVDGVEHFEHFKENYPKEDGAILFLHLWTPKTDLLAAVRKFLDLRHAGKPGRPKKEQMSEIWMPRKPDVPAIRKAISVYRASHITHPHLPQWRIGEMCKVNLSRLEPMADVEDERYRKRILSIMVSNLNRRAAVLIRGVERGLFPARDDDEPCPWRL